MFPYINQSLLPLPSYLLHRATSIIQHLSYFPSSPLLLSLLPSPTFPPPLSYFPSSPLLLSLLPSPTFPPPLSYFPSSPLLLSLLPPPTFPPPLSYSLDGATSLIQHLVHSQLNKGESLWGISHALLCIFPSIL